MKKKISGLYTAIIMPFRSDGLIDMHILEDIIEEQMQARIKGFVILGSTGEWPAINQRESQEIIRFIIKKTFGIVQVIIGIGENNLENAIRKSNIAKNLGADAVLITTPYYNKPTQGGMYKYFIKIADTVNIPLVLYNIPERTNTNLSTNTIIKLTQHNNIVGIKESKLKDKQIMDIINNIPRKFSVLSGSDLFVYPIITLGGHGLVSVVSNIFPQALKCLTEELFQRTTTTMTPTFFDLCPLINAMSQSAVNPIPIKNLLAYVGKIKKQFRPPLTNIRINQSYYLIKIYHEFLNS